MENSPSQNSQNSKNSKNQNEHHNQDGGNPGGTSGWGVSAYGAGNEQTRGSDGSISVKGGNEMRVPTGGVGLTEAVVPVVLFLANNAVSKKLLSQTGLSAKQFKGGKVELPEGGSLANSIAVPAGLVLANHYLGKSLRSRPKPYLGTRRPRFNKNAGPKSTTRRGRFSRGKFRKNR